MPTVTVRRKRPVTVRTLLWDGSNLAEMREFCGPGNFRSLATEDPTRDSEITAQVWDKLHSTWVGVYTGHHVVCGVRNEFYPIEAGVLAETYEPVDGVTV